MALRYIAIGLFCVWLILVLFGKGGFVHLILLAALGIGLVAATVVYRSRMNR